ncbi:hypothetical protein JCGZ_26600 [Jatropha curcas]|uniref:non-specific serine/threonine protein kinase n=1 Tax=Jatropha curcas TaxID=180498 RepID=A0A067JXW8_JATCU|nr:hypothetical protein JCGZ_26600 [Jatropha curcas]
MALKSWSLCLSILCMSLSYFNHAISLHNETDRLALISFKDSIQQDPFQVLSSWNNSLHFCNWYGISCSLRHPNRVIALNLGSQRLVGSLSPHIGNLSFLRRIDLQTNSFHDQIPQEIGRLRHIQYINLGNNSFQGNIPSNLSHCSNLIYLRLTYNQLVGSIPLELGSLTKLEHLVMARNNFTGNIPPSIENLSSLSEISLAYNGIQGQIPKEFSQLRNLNYFLFQGNNLIGEIPSGIFNISELEYFFVQSNRLNGSIPYDVGLTLPKLKYFTVSSNRFSGAIPISMSNASMLEQISFQYNQFSGLIPKQLGMLRYLQILSFYFNQLQDDLSSINSLTNCSYLEVAHFGANFLTGTVPISIANLSKDLYFLSVADNQLHNTIPLGIENLINLRFFLFGGNYFSGPLLINFGKFQQLEELDLRSNRFTGKIPSSIGNLSFVSYLRLGFNNLHGSIPSSLGSCPNLILLDLALNNLIGPIPRQVVSLSSLSILLDLSGNALNGPIPSEVGMLQNLVQLDLSNNRLSGMIPNAIGKCLGLEQLHLQGNSLGGEIPPVLISLRGLRELDISRNNLKGRIPDSLAELHGLSYLNLSFNELQGEVPKHGTFLNANVVSLVGNKGLCGELSKATNGFSEANIVGVGSYGSVYKGLLEQTRKQVAVKVLNLQQRGASNSFISECQALGAIRHRNLLKLLSVCSSIDFEGNDFKALIYEYMANGSLEKWLHAQNVGEDGQERESRNLKLIDRLNIAIDIATAIEYLHSGSSTIVIHGDLKPKYGMGEPVSTKGDIYSYGIPLLEIFTGKRPTDDFFKVDLNLRTFVERSLPYELTNIVDPNIILVEDGGGESFKDAILFVLRIGVACTMEQPGERMEMRDVINELQKIKSSYLKGLLVQNPENAYQFGGPSSSHV